MSEPLGASAPPAAAPPATVPGSAQGAYRWYILVLAALTHTLVVGMPMMSLPVLFDEIGTDLSSIWCRSDTSGAQPRCWALP